MALTLIRSLKMLAAAKKAVSERQSALVASLNRLLPSIGYQVVPLGAEDTSAIGPSPRKPKRAALPVAKPLTCAECKRVFALPLHLGRHLSVMHSAQRVSPAPAPAKASASTEMKPKRRRRAARRTPIRRASQARRALAAKAKRASPKSKKTA